MLNCNNGPTVTPDIFSAAVSYFNASQNYPAGNYSIGYVNGALHYQAGDGFAVSLENSPAPGGYYVTDGNGHVVAMPCIPQRYATQAQAEAAFAGTCANYIHAGGPIGVFLNDAVTAGNPGGAYSDNVAGAPNPTYMLCPGFGTCSAGDPVPPGVPVPTLTGTPSLPGNVPCIILNGY